MMRGWFVVVVVFGAIALAPTTAEACSCSRPAKACEWVFAGTTFVGKVVGTTPQSASDAVTTFEVIETLYSRFPLGKHVDVRHGTDEGACGMSFTRGATYVVDARGEAGPLTTALATGLCSSTHRVNGALADDPAVKLVRAGTTRTKATVKGLVTVRNATESVPKSGVTFRVKGTSRTVTSGAGGALDFEIAPGIYELELATAGMATWHSGEKFPVIVPHPAACATVEADVHWNGEVSGRVTDAAGAPVNNVHVGVVSTSTRRAHGVSAFTQPDGTYAIDRIPPGDYRVGVAMPELGGSTKESPYAVVYHPAASTADKAKLIQLKEGTVVRKVDIVIGPKVPQRTVRIAVVHGNRKPALKATVRIDWVSGTRHTEDVDAKGVYTLSEFDGAALELHACFELPGDGAEELCADRSYTVNGDATITLTLPSKPSRK